jgi:uroporphyrinogen-III synthase
MLILTRPQPDAALTAARLREAGYPSTVFALLEVTALSNTGDVQLVHEVMARLGQFHGVIFVSPNAVRFALAQDMVWPVHTTAYAVGEGTAAALRARGIEPVTAAGSGGSEALYERMRALPLFGKHFLLLRGPDGRAWLADALRSAGTSVTLLKCYERKPAQPSAEQWQALLAAQPSGWSLTSSEAVRHLGVLLARLPHDQSARLTSLPAWVSHPRIASAGQHAGFADIRLTQPGDQGLIDALLHF